MYWMVGLNNVVRTSHQPVEDGKYEGNELAIQKKKFGWTQKRFLWNSMPGACV